ncbi:hypothetical protein OC25_03740 [Pedobacter kyungheensis]|uniref:DUF4133 domain-containing protein n=2 Tax=Pedobacter TaxID=84567 RepID=A0A1G6K237_9SPHI|nr:MULTISPECIES: DUF4133 domain-containing protein [Pedobacter]KIA96203.1 hypothetical protein OC25_03740 [Pedobacter kyungheensis]SDC24685.1 protein of unknown function [Pedobacter soli]
MATIYHINKGVGRPIVFKGLKAQYIAYLALGLVLMLIGFAIGYVSGVPLVFLMVMVGVLGGGLFVVVFHMSAKFGEHGLLKFLAKRGLPKYLVFRSRRLFTRLKNVRL